MNIVKIGALIKYERVKQNISILRLPIPKMGSVP